MPVELVRVFIVLTLCSIIVSSPTATHGAVSLSAERLASSLISAILSGQERLSYVDSAPGSCTVDQVEYQTQTDCAFYTAVATAKARHNSVALVFGSGYYNSCAELVEPTGFYTVDLIGESMRTTFLNKTCATPHRPVISKGEPTQFGNLVIRNLTIQANSLADSCLDIWGVNGGEFVEIDCIGVIDGSDHMIQFGEPGHFPTGGVEQSTFRHIFASSPFSHRGREAHVLARVVGGAVTGYSVVDRGSGYADEDVVVDIYGYGRGSIPCETMPRARAVITSGSVAEVVPVSSGSGCVGQVDVQVLNLVNIRYGIDMTVSDSLIEDVVSLVGTDSGAGIRVTGGNNTVVHAHPTNVPIGILNAAQTNNSYLGTECDTVSHYCVDFEGVGGTTVSGTTAYTYGHMLPGFSDFYFGRGAKNVTFGAQGNLCSAGSPAVDFHEFVTQEGPYDAGHLLPDGVVAYANDQSCVNIGTFAGFPSARIGPPIPSTSSIVLSGPLQHITGGGDISFITLPPGFSDVVGGCVTLIADGHWSTRTTGNIANAMTATVGAAYEACYGGSRWSMQPICSQCAVRVAHGSATLRTNVLTSRTCMPRLVVADSEVSADDVVQINSHIITEGAVGQREASESSLMVNAFASDGHVNIGVCNATASTSAPAVLKIEWQVLR